MPRIDPSEGLRALAMLGCLAMCSAIAQPKSAPSSLETVDALLQAENQSILQRAAATSPQAPGTATSAQAAPATVAPVQQELSVLSVYGLSSDLRVDLRHGDAGMTGLRKGQRAGPVQVVAIEGACARLVVSGSQGRQEVRPCWSMYGASTTGATKPESARNTPAAPDINAPVLPMAPSLLDLARGAFGNKPAPVPLISP